MKFRFIEAADESVDAEYAVETDLGIGTTLSIQVGEGYFAVNEYLYENGCISGAVHHGMFRTLAAAKKLAAKLYHQRYITA